MKYTSFDQYIDLQADFARPILQHLRTLIRSACPDGIEEFKWNFPHFTYKGVILCHLGAFKSHLSVGFWLSAIMDDPDGILQTSERESMGNLGRIKRMEDLPAPEVLVRYVHHAMDLIDQGRKLPSVKEKPKDRTLSIPKILETMLDANPKAKGTFESFSYSAKKDYTLWIDEAKTEATKIKRATQAVEWLEEGKKRHWKYEK